MGKMQGFYWKLQARKARYWIYTYYGFTTYRHKNSMVFNINAGRFGSLAITDRILAVYQYNWNSYEAYGIEYYFSMFLVN